MKKFDDASVESVFVGYPARFRDPLLKIREWIFTLSEQSQEIGPLQETLKWGQPGYVTHKSKSGSTVRLDRFGPDKIAVFFHCKTTLVDTFGTLFPGVFEFSKNRAIVLDPDNPIPEAELQVCLEMALTYHLQKRKNVNVA